jgi:hypothetical protein
MSLNPYIFVYNLSMMSWIFLIYPVIVLYIWYFVIYKWLHNLSHDKFNIEILISPEYDE